MMVFFSREYHDIIHKYDDKGQEIPQFAELSARLTETINTTIGESFTLKAGCIFSSSNPNNKIKTKHIKAGRFHEKEANTGEMIFREVTESVIMSIDDKLFIEFENESFSTKEKFIN